MSANPQVNNIRYAQCPETGKVCPGSFLGTKFGLRCRGVAGLSLKSFDQFVSEITEFPDRIPSDTVFFCPKKVHVEDGEVSGVPKYAAKVGSKICTILETQSEPTPSEITVILSKVTFTGSLGTKIFGLDPREAITRRDIETVDPQGA